MHLHAVTIVVPDYNAGIAFYVGKVGFRLVQDIDLGAGKRWVLITPDPVPSATSAHILLAEPGSPEQTAAIGAQTGGRVGFFLHSDDFAADHRRLLANGVEFEEDPRHEPYGTVAVWHDPWGNRWDLLQLT